MMVLMEPRRERSRPDHDFCLHEVCNIELFPKVQDKLWYTGGGIVTKMLCLNEIR